MNEDFLNRKLQQRRESYAFRELQLKKGVVDFCSNDYLGMVAANRIHSGNENGQEKLFGSTGSRLISGNYTLIEDAEKQLAEFHNAPSGLIFNSGYDANLGLLGCVLQRNDTVLYDQLCHASIRDGIRLSHAFAFSFEHNDVEDLEKRLQQATGNIFVVTESVFSMDGDMAPLEQITEVCRSYNALLIVDEAHATGVIGRKGEGLVQHLGLESRCFARIHTFGKAVGCHGAIVLGSNILRNYLINFSRPFIYTTGMPASAVLAILRSYLIFPSMENERVHLFRLVKQFRDNAGQLRLCSSVTPIQGVIIPGNEAVKQAAQVLQQHNLDVRPILYPTVSRGQERLRIVIHSFNTESEIQQLLTILESRK
ncbi:MAG TPA: pyridoxal phosphate-dependent aminotransferase family protein [Flavitalea sp.]|nr:pyridoxal phosphate-dependent aminotransferase family protein [Flavitalea sp.]